MWEEPSHEIIFYKKERERLYIYIYIYIKWLNINKSCTMSLFRTGYLTKTENFLLKVQEKKS